MLHIWVYEYRSGQVVIINLVPAVNATSNSLYWLLSPAISWSETRCLPVVLPYLEIPALCKFPSTQSIQCFFGLPRDRLLFGCHLNTCFTVLLSDIRRMCPVYFICILVILLLSWVYRDDIWSRGQLYFYGCHRNAFESNNHCVSTTEACATSYGTH